MSRKMGGARRGKAREWALAAMVAAMLVVVLAFGENRETCRTAYLESGLSWQQVSFDEFRELHGGGLCETPGALARSDQASDAERRNR